MGDPHGPGSSDSALLFDESVVSPYHVGNGKQLAPVWENSDDLRSLLASKKNPSPEERYRLRGFLNYQLNTLWLYWRLVEWRRLRTQGLTDVTGASLYVLLFPGEGRDGTGIKELNDTLGYFGNSEFIRRRQVAIAEIFNLNASKFEAAAQMYKASYVFTDRGTRSEFEVGLRQLDARMRADLIELLKRAQAGGGGDSERGRKIAKLLRTLERNPEYRFDLFFGFRQLTLGSNDLDNVMLLVTEALKGAGMGRFIAKRSKSKRLVRSSTTRIPSDPRGDVRGKAFDWRRFLAAAAVAGEIKKLCATSPNQEMRYDLQSVYVDRVWARSFLPYKNLYVGNPDVIRDVRKKKLERPRGADGNIVVTYQVMRDFLELWLVTLNMLDFVKRFKTSELRKEVLSYHREARAALLELADEHATIDWARLERILTTDVRQHERIAQNDSASEFQFYACAADHSERIFFNMDVRDMGVELLLSYETSNRLIESNRYSDVDLMEESFRATDVIDERRRYTYDRVVEVFHRHHALIGKNLARARSAARRAFGDIAGLDRLPPAGEALQIMLGGDEVFVAAHPLFTEFAHTIVAELDALSREHPFEDKRLDLRVGLANSRAPKDPDQRRANQVAHQDAMADADIASAAVKPYERWHRRIERLLDMLEANTKKASKAPPYRRALDDLGLLRLFGRAKPRPGSREPPAERRRREQERAAEGLRSDEDPDVELVDFSGKVVSEPALQRAAMKLEKQVTDDVGLDNTRQQLPAGKLPPWMGKAIACLEDIPKCLKKL